MTLDAVSDYYGRVLRGTADLATNACCPTEAMPAHLRPLVGLVHDEVSSRFYGCGSPIPAALEGCTVLDLGCGTGRDAVLCSALAGPTGRVIGVDMTAEQIAVAERHVGYHTERLGYSAPTLSFRRGYIEDLGSVGIADASVDVVISNCVVNLSPDKGRVLAEVFRVLKPGGELYFADIFASRRVPRELVDDPVLYGECLSGAMYVEDFRRMLREVGCSDYRTMTRRVVTVGDPAIAARVGHIEFTSRTVRAFKLPLEDQCEDYGQVAVYRGTERHSPVRFALDDHHVFERGRPMLVCGNTADMLSSTRFAEHFEVRGEKREHFGLFPCGPAASSPGDPAGGQCC